MKGLFRSDFKKATPIKIGKKFGIQAGYNNGTKELLSRIFDSTMEAQKEINETLKAKQNP